jgi:hypothetical protein
LPLGSSPRRSVPVPLVLGAVLLAAGSTLFTSPWMGLGALVLLAVAFVLVHVVIRRGRTRGWVALTERGIARIDRSGKEVPLASWGEPFGVAVLANHARTHALLAFTTPHHTRFLAIRLPDGEADAALVREVFLLAATVADADVIRDDGAALAPADAAELIRSIRARAPNAIGRIYLSGAADEDIVLEERELRCGQRTFDLRAPLEWRGFLFHESMGAVATVYQATWIRQGATELVVVAPLPPEISVGRQRDVRLHPSFLRDLKLMQATPDEPPPRELRFAIERVFMLPLRQALDRAPRASRPTAPPSRLSSAHG